MHFDLEWKKMKRTGLWPAFAGGSILAALVPVVNMAARSESFVKMEGSPLQILLGANWQMMAMLNILLVVAGACILYHTEYAEHAIQKLYTLPIKDSTLFFEKFLLLVIMCAGMLAIEAVELAFCSFHWFTPENGFLPELFENIAYSLLLLIPAVLTALLIAALFKNMWVSLGIGVVAILLATMIPTGTSILSLFPFVMHLHMTAGITECIIESLVLALAAVPILKVRRTLA